MAANAKKHQIRRVVEAIHASPWAIEPEKLQQIQQFMERRAAGDLLTEEEIRVRFGGRGLFDDDEEEPADPYQNVDGVAVIPVYGVISPRANILSRYSGGTSTQQLGEAVLEAAADKDVKSIVLDVDSPGGNVLGVEEVTQIIRKVRDDKPVYTVATNQMTSAAYQIGSAATKVYSGPSASIGSLGVYTIHTDYSRALKNDGVDKTLIKSGRYKANENPIEPLTADRRAVIQEDVDDYYRMMVDSVAKNRNITPETVEAKFGQGKAMIASKALEAGLIDRIATLSEVVNELAAKHSSDQNTQREQVRAHSAPPVFSSSQELVTMAQENATTVAASAETEPAKATTQAVTQQVTQSAAAQVVTQPTQTAAQAAVQERHRITEIQARGELLGVDKAAIDSAVESGASLEAFLMDATSKRAAVEKPVHTVEAGQSARDKFSAAAGDALALRAGVPIQKPAAGSEAFKHARLTEIARESLRLKCGRAIVGDPDTIARAALGDPEALSIFGADVPYNRPGDFPNILSVLANKTLEAAPQYAGTTFQIWAARKPSVPDFKPQTLVRVGEFGEFPHHPDGKDFEQSTMSSDWNWLSVDSYGDEFALTPRMIVDDNLGAFTEALTDKQGAHDMTLNRMCVDLLTGNPTLPDTGALFNTTALTTAGGHNNLAGSGAAVSKSTLSAARLALRSMTGVSRKRKLNYNVEFLLVPPDIETTCDEVLRVNLQIYPASTAAVTNVTTGADVFRGRVAFYVEPMLGDASTTAWFAFANVAIARPIVYCYQQGYERMQTRNYYNPKNNCRIWQFEGRFAAAVNNPLGVYKNAGA